MTGGEEKVRSRDGPYSSIRPVFSAIRQQAVVWTTAPATDILFACPMHRSRWGRTKYGPLLGGKAMAVFVPRQRP
jgi:hypothetical protein